MRIIAVTVFAVGAVVLTTTCFAVPTPVFTSLRFTFSLDRESYLEHEPILVEYTLTNTSGADLLMANLASEYFVQFSCTDSENKPIGHAPREKVTLGKPNITIFRRDSSVKRWVDLHDFLALPNLTRASSS